MCRGPCQVVQTIYRWQYTPHSIDPSNEQLITKDERIYHDKFPVYELAINAKIEVPIERKLPETSGFIVKYISSQL